MRADIQHEVGHDAIKLPFLPRFQHIRIWPPTSAGKSRCLPVTLHTEAFTHSKLLHTASFYTDKHLHREALHREALSQRSIYTEKLLHREEFTRNKLSN